MRLNPNDLQVTAISPQVPEHRVVDGPARHECVRILHKPTGCVVECRAHPTQYRNKHAALAGLKAMLGWLKDEEFPDDYEV